MKLYRQGESEIRIRLTKEDLASFSITAEELDYDSAHGKRVIWELFDKARRETGFDATGEKIYIQFYPTDQGGCELFVTKLEKEQRSICFCFSDFDGFYHALGHNKHPLDCQVWKDTKKSTFYVLISEKDAPPLFFEFGEKIKVPSLVFLNSRCQKIHWKERLLYGSTQS